MKRAGTRNMCFFFTWPDSEMKKKININASNVTTLSSRHSSSSISLRWDKLFIQSGHPKIKFTIVN